MSTKNLFQRIIAASEQANGMSKDVTVGSGSYSYKGISHDSVVKAVRGAAFANGIAIFHSVIDRETEEGTTSRGGAQYITRITMETTFVNADDPSEKFTIKTIGTGVDSLDKGEGKAMSYAKKYALQLAFQMVTDDGDEGRIQDDGNVTTTAVVDKAFYKGPLTEAAAARDISPAQLLIGYKEEFANKKPVRSAAMRWINKFEAPEIVEEPKVEPILPKEEEPAKATEAAPEVAEEPTAAKAA